MKWTRLLVHKKWSKKAAEKLEKLNKDSNLTAGLEAVLYLAVGARVMLRRNIDTTNGLVNGACGTVTAVGKKAVDLTTTRRNMLWRKSRAGSLS